MNITKAPSTPRTVLSSLKNNINKVCDELTNSLMMPPTQATSYHGITTAEKLDSEFIDVIVRKVVLLKTYLLELKRYVLHNPELSLSELNEVFGGCDATILLVMSLCKKDAYFLELLKMPCIELKNIVKEIKQSVVVVQ